jgi:two-component system, OmpR family, response regulator
MAFKILMVDDSEVELQWAQQALSPLGVEVLLFRASIGIRAFIYKNAPSLVLLDINMPALSGDRICKLLKADEKTAAIPVFLYSSIASEELAKKAHEAGADGCILKNHDVAALRRVITSAMAAHQLREARACHV